MNKKKKKGKMYYGCVQAVLSPFFWSFAEWLWSHALSILKREHLNVLEKKWDFTMLLKFDSFWQCCNVVKKFII